LCRAEAQAPEATVHFAPDPLSEICNFMTKFVTFLKLANG
jgi:hypothetical protein